MKANFCGALAAVLVCASIASAQTAADFGTIRITFNDTSGNLTDPPGAFINFGSSRLFAPVFIDAPLPANNALNQPSGLYFKARYDSDTTAGVTQAFSSIGLNGRLTAITGGEMRLFLNSTTPPGATDGDLYVTAGSFLGHAPAAAYSGRLSAANEGLLRYDRTAQRWQVSTNAGAWGNLLRAGDTGIVTSVALTMPTWFTVAGSPITSSGTLAVTAATQAANTALRGPASGVAAAPTFRTMVAADIPNGTITFAHWASNSCSDQQIPKWNATAVAWQCALDATSAGGTSWVTAGNAGTGGTGNVGTTDAFRFNFLTNNVARGGWSSDGASFWNGIATASAPGVSAASTGRIYYDSTLQQFRMSLNGAAYTNLGTFQTLTMPTGFTVTGSGTAAISVAFAARTWVQWSAKQATQPSASYAVFTTRNDHPLLAYNDSTDTAAIWEGVMPEEYDGGQIDIVWSWAAATATTGNVVWECAVERDDVATNIGADSWGTTTTTTSTTLGTAGELKQNVCSMSSAALRDNVTTGEPFRIRIRRIGTNAGDTMVGDAQLATVQVRHP